MRTSDMIKSKFWRATDLQGQPAVVLTIADVTEELMGRGSRQDVKCFLWFTEHLKGLQLNKSRVRVLEAAYGPDSVLWTGKRVRLSFDPTVEFGGRAVGGVRLQTPPGIVYTPGVGHAGWGEAPSPAVPAGAPPPPVWNGKEWVFPTSAPAAAPARPPPPVWNGKEWVTVDPSTGEMAPPAHQRPLTISERVNAGHPVDKTDGWNDLAPAAPAGAAREEDFDDDIPF